MYSRDTGQPAQVSTWLLNVRRKRSGRRVVLALVVTFVEIGLLVTLYVVASAFFPH